MTRQLIIVNKNDSKPLKSLPLHTPQCVGPDTNLVELVNLFQSGGGEGRCAHLALVCARPTIGNAALEQHCALPEEAGLMGIVTLEDVLEALLQEQILDEMDVSGRIQSVDSEDDLEGKYAYNPYHCMT